MGIAGRREQGVRLRGSIRAHGIACVACKRGGGGRVTRSLGGFVIAGGVFASRSVVSHHPIGAGRGVAGESRRSQRRRSYVSGSPAADVLLRSGEEQVGYPVGR